MLEISRICSKERLGRTLSSEISEFRERFNCSMLRGSSHRLRMLLFDRFSLRRIFSDKSSCTAVSRLFPEISNSIYVNYTRFLNLSRPGSEDLCLFMKIRETWAVGLSISSSSFSDDEILVIFKLFSRYLLRNVMSWKSTTGRV